MIGRPCSCREKVLNLWTRRRQVFFFFQAEDGIRDYKVTGVQTCALPISPSPSHGWRRTMQTCTEARPGRVALSWQEASMTTSVSAGKAASLQLDIRRVPMRQPLEIGRASCRERV